MAKNPKSKQPDSPAVAAVKPREWPEVGTPVWVAGKSWLFLDAGDSHVELGFPHPPPEGGSHPPGLPPIGQRRYMSFDEFDEHQAKGKA